MHKLVSCLALAFVVGCDQQGAAPGPQGSGAQPETVAAAAKTEPAKAPEATAPALPADPKNIVNVAGGSADHTTLVAALKAADYLYSISNPGPFTVFAPTNAAFDKLPKGTVEGLLVPAKKDDLRTVLKHHVAVSTYQLKDLHDGQTLGMADGGKVTVHVKDGKTSIDDARVVASIPCSNGIIHVVDGVILPQAK